MAQASLRSSHLVRASIKNWSKNYGVAGAATVQMMQVANLTLLHGGKFPYPKPYPYKKHRLNPISNIWQNTTKRLNDHSRIITIEGSVGIGKNEFAKRVAKEFDLLYVPGIHDDDLYIQNWNMFNLRDLNEALPPLTRFMDFKELYSSDEIDLGKAARMQCEVLEKRLLKYCYSCLHLLSTGQGFVTVRTPYSDQVFCDAMYQMGWISGAYAQWHRHVMSRLRRFVLAPHLTVYLDAPVPYCMEAISKKERDDPKFIGGKNLNEKFLTKLEDRYARWIADQPSREGEVLKIDWDGTADESEMDMIVEVIAQIDLEPEDDDTDKFRDWTELSEDIAGTKRLFYSNPDRIRNEMFAEQPTRAAEFTLHTVDQDERDYVLSQHEMVRYDVNHLTRGRYGLWLNPLRYG